MIETGYSTLRFKTFGSRDPHRPAEDVAFSVARFFQKGGSLHNYYMVNDFKLISIYCLKINAVILPFD